MKNLLSPAILLITSFQGVLLYLIFQDRLADLPGNLPDVLWLGTALLSLLLGLLFFRGRRAARLPGRTLSDLALLAWMTFPLLVFGKGAFLLLPGVATVCRHFRKYPEERFTIVPAFSMVTAVWSLGMYLFARFVTSM